MRDLIGRVVNAMNSAEAGPQRMSNNTNTFYDGLADSYHLFYRDWEATLEREGATLRHALRGQDVNEVLDASCGTGTQAIALARNGFRVTAADPSPNMLSRAQENARLYGVLERMTLIQTDFLGLCRALMGPFDAVITKGNSLPHLLTDTELQRALYNFSVLLRPGGKLLIGMRDFDFLLEDRPRFIPRQLHTDDPERDVILFDVWDWDDGPPVTVTFNTFIVTGRGEQYGVSKHPVMYRALRREELETMLAKAGFVDVACEADGWELLFTARKAG